MKNLILLIYCFLATLLLFVFGCAHPTGFEDGEFAARTPEEVAAKLSRAYQETKLDGYLSLFSEDCRFLYGGEYMWGKTQEQKIHQRMFAAAKNIELKLTEALNEEATETARRSIYSYYLQIELRNEETLKAQGQVELGLARNTLGIWQISSFREFNTDLHKCTSTALNTSAANNSANYFPLLVGNRWSYEEIYWHFSDYESVVKDSLIIQDNIYYSVEDFGAPPVIFTRPAFLRVDSLQKLHMFLESDSTDIILFDFGSAIGDSLVFMPPGFSEIVVVELITQKDSVTVPAGTFNHVLEFELTDYNSGSRCWYEFAKGIGLIRELAPGEVFVLKSAYVNGELIVSVAEEKYDWTEIKRRF